MDPWKESVACYEKLADEVTVLGENFKKEFAFSDLDQCLMMVLIKPAVIG